ncbi:DUF523 domain-containing protein [archaeon]|jgi:uncharacterized protein YbbK (DUF523 family)|nr:DUF523 domain-containing protein [archaeon]MBT6824348.1 DUF523 domain-containing protein [archaeon]MBT7106898.1 DUF523 domain-containing protein [archaeon]MBT7297451.1 DUF523 domain-containing protein [archaeon]
MKIVSACLAGIECRWDGKSKPCQKVIDLVKTGKAIPICPEELGGLATPREPSEQKNNKILTKSGKDLTQEFESGAEKALRIAKLNNCTKAILKSKSPSCGSKKIYDGTFSNKLIEGEGIFTKILRQNGIKVLNEDEI